jgi:hypothetical protein
VFIEVTFQNGLKSVIGSIYRPGSRHPLLSNAEQFSQFSELISNLCSELSSTNSTNFILGDFNLDVLQYGNNAQVTEYVDLLFSFGLLQIILKPTRIANRAATAIDHVITNSVNPKHKSVIITSRLSDHFPIIYFPDLGKNTPSKPEFVESRDFSINNIERFCANLHNVNWVSVFSSIDTQTAFNNFFTLFSNLYDLHFPLTRKKKKKNSILTSIVLKSIPLDFFPDFFIHIL